MKTTQELKELLYKNKTVADQQPDAIAEANAFCEGYKAFLNAAKTEREAAAYSEQLLKQAGYKPFVPGMALNAGDKVYLINRSKCVLAATIGERSMAEGFHLNIAHIDSPRLDLRPVPLFEKDGLAYFRTHYYGGIRKYQWPTIPLALHGVVCREDGTTVTITIGENDEDPVFTITDLLPHLGREQNQKKLPDAITAENLNVVLGSLPIADADAENRIKLSILGLLNEMYGITERDFVTAEIEIVPAFKARDVGLDRSMIGSYGHDDRVCAYAAFKPLLDLGTPVKTAVCVLADKEEIGSVGISGMQSQYFEMFMEDLCEAAGASKRRCFEHSFCLSADVSNAFDPLYAETCDPTNNTKINYGTGIFKYTGARGKSGSSDAAAEVMGYVRRIFAKHDVIWQTGELGKVDQGGGGTIAKFMADRNIDTIDAGVPVLSMHAPFELVAKFDCWMTYRGVLAAYCDTQA